MGPRTKFIWSYETPICFLKSCDHKTVLYFVTTICLLLVHWKISSSYTYTTLATIEASWSFIKHSWKFWRMAVSDWSAVIYLSATGEASWSFIKHSRHFWRIPFSYWSTAFYPFIHRWGKLEFHKTKSAFLEDVHLLLVHSILLIRHAQRTFFSPQQNYTTILLQ